MPTFILDRMIYLHIALFRWMRLSLFSNVKDISSPLQLLNLLLYCFFGYLSVVFVSVPFERWEDVSLFQTSPFFGSKLFHFDN